MAILIWNISLSLPKQLTLLDERRAKLLADLISNIIQFDANSRLTPEQALKHPFFNDVDTDYKIDEESSQDEDKVTQKHKHKKSKKSRLRHE